MFSSLETQSFEHVVEPTQELSVFDWFELSRAYPCKKMIEKYGEKNPCDDVTCPCIGPPPYSEKDPRCPPKRKCFVTYDFAKNGLKGTGKQTYCHKF